ncbi:uncharacterized protein LOC143459257 isoform X2 [Clavelina lepadiformis]|uniref:uncharacterized protein LOC143459257 isoform X2 n=1 Tax=Clavelina lepadiformis TaxID=159417 RepID=UPI0040433A0B
MTLREESSLQALLALQTIAKMTIPQDSNSQKKQDKQKGGTTIDNGLNANTSSGIELLLLLEGKSGEYMESGRYEDCYEVTRRLYDAGPDANFLTVLLRSCNKCFRRSSSYLYMMS